MLLPLVVAFVWKHRGQRAALRALALFVAVVALSPQFMIWLVPLVPLVAGRVGVAASALFAAAVALTQSWFPGRWRQVLDLGSADWLVLSRNLVLVAMTALLVLAVRLGRDSPTKATEASSTQ